MTVLILIGIILTIFAIIAFVCAGAEDNPGLMLTGVLLLGVSVALYTTEAYHAGQIDQASGKYKVVLTTQPSGESIWQSEKTK